MTGLSIKPRASGTPHTVQKMLVRLGVPKGRIYHDCNTGIVLGPFWRRPESKLLEFLESARKGWKQRLKEHHPDKSGGSVELAAELNVMWKRVQVLFKRRGITLP